MAAAFVLKELFAIATCWLITVRRSKASFRSSASVWGLNGAAQRVRIFAMIDSIRASVDDGIAIFYGASLAGSIQNKPELFASNDAVIWLYSEGRNPSASKDTESVQNLRTARKIQVSGCGAKSL